MNNLSFGFVFKIIKEGKSEEKVGATRFRTWDLRVISTTHYQLCNSTCLHFFLFPFVVVFVVFCFTILKKIFFFHFIPFDSNQL